MKEYKIDSQDLQELTCPNEGSAMDNLLQAQKLCHLRTKVEHWLINHPEDDKAKNIRNSLDGLIFYLESHPRRLLRKVCMLTMNDLWESYRA